MRIKFSVLSILILFFISCSGSDRPSDPGNSDPREENLFSLYGAKVSANFGSLPECDSVLLGALFYVLEDSSFYFCHAEGYSRIDLQGISGDPGSDGQDGLNGKDGMDGENGVDGEDGLDGKNGLDGSSCSITGTSSQKTITCGKTTATVNDGAPCTLKTTTLGYTLTCGTTSVDILNGINGQDCKAKTIPEGVEIQCGSIIVDTLVNGEKGETGDDGRDGSDNCTITDDHQGTITQNCGGTEVSWPKALCGSERYEPDTHFCSFITQTVRPWWSPYCNQSGRCGEFLDPRDTTIYRWTKIGSLTWFAENIHFETFDVNGPTSYCNPEDPSYCSTYGRLYNWSTAQTVCPSGWHLPSKEEWSSLFASVNAPGQEAKVLKADSSLWTTNTGTDTFGFSALPGGSYTGSTYLWINSNGYWWTSTEADTDNTKAEAVRLYGSSDEYFFLKATKGLFYSVRCVKDTE